MKGIRWLMIGFILGAGTISYSARSIYSNRDNYSREASTLVEVVNNLDEINTTLKDIARKLNRLR